MKKQLVLVSFSLFMTLPAAGMAAEKASEPGTGDQRAACDAGCRENYQNNSAAMQACLRDCGAIGPASPQGAMAPAHEAAHTVQQTTTVKGSKSNSDNRNASPATQPAEAPTVKASKSNSSDRQAAPDTGETPPAEPGSDVPADG